MATDINSISYTGSAEPVEKDYPNEREFAQAFQEWGNRRNLQLLINQGKALNLDDNQNAGTPSASAKSPATVNITTPANTGQKTGKNLVDQNFPGKRKDNPLSYYSSYTYSLTLYMVTPEFMNEFTNGPAAGTLPANRISSNQIFVVAQSGGTNNNVDSRALTLSKNLGPNQQGLDFFIDDLAYTTTLPGGPKGQTTATDLTFKIIEPNGFTFLQDLTIASNRLNTISPIIKSKSTVPLALDQNYIISIRYYGYDVSGNLMQSVPGPTNFSDPKAASERHLPIKISNIKFKLDEKSTTYTVVATNLSEQVAFARSKNTIEQQTSVSGTTVKDALLGGSGGAIGLLQVINGVNKDKKDKNKLIESPNEYTIEFIGKDNPIANSLLIDDTAFESRISKMSSVSSTDQSNISASFKAVTVNTKARSLSIAAGTSIIQAIDNIIIKSDFITSALNQVNTGAPETKTVGNASKKPLQWYSINPVVTIKGMDPKTNVWSYKINYQIGVYDIPYARTPYANAKVKYPGPYKYYGYFLTGENTEILEYEQIYDNLYTITTTKTTGESKTSVSDIKKTGVQNTPGPSNDSVVGGKIGRGSEVNESVRAVLYSPGDRAIAKIKILGDPDYIMSIVGVNQNITSSASSSANALYGPDNSINPFGGQVFIQIMFNITTDYQNNGVMDISDKIQFYDNPIVADSGIKGVVYKVNQVDSTFSKGLFTQLLECIIVESNQLLTETDKKSVERITDKSKTGTGTTTSRALNVTEKQKYDVREPNPDYFSGLSGTSQSAASQSTAPQSAATVPSKANLQESANDDQRTVNRNNVESLYTVEPNSLRTDEENAKLQEKADLAAERAGTALQSMPGSTRTGSGVRRF